MIRIDVHQHLWTQPLIDALAARRELPFVRRAAGLTVLHVAGERPYVLDTSGETPAARAARLRLDGLDQALVCLSSPVGIESLPREQSAPLLEAYHDGALSLGEPFGVWAAVALDRPDPDDVDRALDRGCIGLSLPAGALASVEAVSGLRALLARLEARDVPLLVHPGPGPAPGARAAEEARLSDPLWWPALTRYVAQMQAAWLAFVSAGRALHAELRVIFSMLGGMAPLQAERLLSRGGPAPCLADPLVFYDTSSYGPEAVRVMAGIVGARQLLFGSDRPVVEPGELEMPHALDWDLTGDGARRAFGGLNNAHAAPTYARAAAR
jgi:hypothetical protein